MKLIGRLITFDKVLDGLFSRRCNSYHNNIKELDYKHQVLFLFNSCINFKGVKMSNKISFDKTYKQFYSNYPISLSFAIYEELEDNQHITEQTFIKACRDVFKYKLKQLKEQTKIEYLRVCPFASGFNLIAARKETKKEMMERLEEERNSSHWRQANLKKDLQSADYLNAETIDTLIEILNNKKLVITK